MPKNPAFELFELVCRELVTRAEMILPEDDIPPEIVEDLKERYEARNVEEVYMKVVGHDLNG